MAKLKFHYAAMNAGESPALFRADFKDRDRGTKTMLRIAVHDRPS